MKKIIYVLLIFMTILTSCTDVIDLELNVEDLDLLVVDAEITSQDNAYAYITKSITVSSDSTNPTVSNATVIISDNAQPANTMTLVERGSIPGFYTTPEGEDYKGVVGRTYTLTIYFEGDTIKASDVLYKVPNIDSLIIKPSQRGEEMFLGVYIASQEPAETKNFYKWDIYVNDTCLDGLQYLAFSDDRLYEGNYVDSAEIYTDFHDPAKDEERALGYLDTVYVKQLSMSEQVYDYYYALMLQFNSGGPFSVPPANTPTNMNTTGTKEVRGLFRAHDVSISNVVIIDDSIENKLNKSTHGF